MGRPTKWTSELQAVVCEKLRNGTPAKWAARAAGIGPSAFYDWMKRGEAGEEPYAGFRDAVEQAEAEAVCNAHTIGMAGGKGSSFSTFWLERSPRTRDEYRPHQRVDREGAGRASEVRIIVEGGLRGGRPRPLALERLR